MYIAWLPFRLFTGEFTRIIFVTIHFSILSQRHELFTSCIDPRTIRSFIFACTAMTRSDLIQYICSSTFFFFFFRWIFNSSILVCSNLKERHIVCFIIAIVIEGKICISYDNWSPSLRNGQDFFLTKIGCFLTKSIKV